MNYNNHPTWRMLEAGKQKLRSLLNDLPRFHPYHDVVKEAHDSLVRLQLRVEDKICSDMQ